MLIKYTFFWIGAVVLAIANGTLREKVYGPRMSELAAHQVSTAIALVLFGIYYLLLAWAFPLESAAQALQVGLIWLLLTVLFEFIFGHYVVGHPWSHLLRDYNLAAGRLWVLVLVWITVAPWLIHGLITR